MMRSNPILEWKRNLSRCNSLPPPVHLSQKYFINPTFDIRKYQKFPETEIRVVNNDTLDETLNYDSDTTLLLNMGNPYSPGGKLETIGAQEEDLFRRTDLCLHLTKNLYPIDNASVIISKNVRVFSSGIRNNYQPLPQEKQINVITCAAIVNSSIGIVLDPKDALLMQMKIEAMFQNAVVCGYTTIILSAFGCGGFRCPPEHVSVLFKRALEKFRGGFERVIFAIFNENYSKCNYAIFRNTLIT